MFAGTTTTAPCSCPYLMHSSTSTKKITTDRRAPDNMRGVEVEVARRNEVFEGKSLQFASSEFFSLVQRWEEGYRHAFSKPYLLATFMGDLPGEIRRVVGAADAVKIQWKRCVSAASGWNPDPSADQALYDFILQNFHNVRFAEYCRRLGMVSEQFKREKATQQALRAKLKGARSSTKCQPRQGLADGGGASSENSGLHARAKEDLIARKFTDQFFGKLTNAQLRQYIQDVGGNLKGQSKATKIDLQAQLKVLVPGIICSGENDPEVDDFDVATVVAIEALGGDVGSQG